MGRVQRIEYDYSAAGRLASVTAYTYDGGTETVLAQNVFTYDARGNLIAEDQAHFDLVGASTRAVEYGWEWSPYDGVNPSYERLATITYPTRTDQSALVLHFDYGSDIDDALSRTVAIHDGDANDPFAEYTYGGMTRRVGVELGDGLVSQDFVGSGVGSGYHCLDRFGRIKDLYYAGANHRYEYAYDDAGNRTYAYVTHMASDGQSPLENMRSRLYTYDSLNRLVEAGRGHLNQDRDALVGFPTAQVTSWSLDNLGNWSGGDAVNGSVTLPNGWIHHATNDANQVTTLSVNDGSATTTTTFVYDYAGNLVFDGEFFYQYDAFNRLVRVMLAGSVTAGDFDSAGQLLDNPSAPALIGDPVVDFFYDGLGRLIRKEARVDAACTAPASCVVREDYYYDGFRRIQEVEEYEEETAYYLGLTPAPADVCREREYVYGPDYGDEFVCQIDEAGGAVYMLQDANFNVVALVGGSASAEVQRQYVYTPYGRVAMADAAGSTATPTSRVGHQGLFFERFYVEPGATVLDPVTCTRRKQDMSIFTRCVTASVPTWPGTACP